MHNAVSPPQPPGCTRRSALVAGIAAASTKHQTWAASGPGGNTQTNTWPPSIALDFKTQGKAKGFNINASGGLEWRRNAQAYEARLFMSALLIFKREQFSAGHIGAQGIQPLQFEDRKKQIHRADFDPAGGQVRYSYGAQNVWPENGQDSVSLLIAIGELTRQVQANGGRHVTIPVSDGRHWQEWTFDIAGRETINTANGAWPAIHLKRSDAHRRGQETDLWLAPSLHGLPVRILMREPNGDMADQVLSAHRTLPDLPAT